MGTQKPWLSCEQQVELLVSRGLAIQDKAAAEAFLAQVSYYRLSGYFRYWQRDPGCGDDNFREGSSFEEIRQLYDSEQALVLVCDEVLHPIEVQLRARFAHHYARLVGSQGGFATGQGLTQPPDPKADRIQEYPLADLDRSKESFVAHYRDDVKDGGRYSSRAYARMPIWVAVEAFSFGTLSRLVTASEKSGVLAAVAASMSVSPKTLPSQVRSFVYLRNRIAHCAKIWNHSVLDVPGLLPNVARRAKKNHRSFTDHSVYKILVALDYVAKSSGLVSDWLSTRVDPILEASPLLEGGITRPRKYGEGLCL